MEVFSHSCCLEGFTSSLQKIEMKHQGQYIFGRGFTTNINDIVVSNKAVAATLCQDHVYTPPYLEIIRLGRNKITVENPGEQHPTEVCKNESIPVFLYPGGSVEICTNRESGLYKYKFVAQETFRTDLLQRQAQLQLDLLRLQQLIDYKKNIPIQTQTLVQTGKRHNREYSDDVPVPKKQRTGASYSLKKPKRSCAILTYRLPEGGTICYKQKTGEIVSLVPKEISTNTILWKGNKALPVGYQLPPRLFSFFKRNFIPLELHKEKHLYFQYFTFSKEGNLTDPKILDTTFLPFMQWVCDLEEPETMKEVIVTKICHYFLDPKQTDFPDSLVQPIVNRALSAFKDNHLENEKEITILILFLCQMLLLFEKYVAKSRVLVQKENISVFNTVINYLQKDDNNPKLQSDYSTLKSLPNSNSPLMFLQANVSIS